MDVQFRACAAILCCFTLPVVGCRTTTPCSDPHMVSRQMVCRISKSMETVLPCQTRVPSSVLLEDGLSEEEAILTALSNNSAFQATLAQLRQPAAMRYKRRCLRTLNSSLIFPVEPRKGSIRSMRRLNPTCCAQHASKLPIVSTVASESNWSRMGSIFHAMFVWPMRIGC